MNRLIRWSAVLTLVALALMVWSVLVPTPLPVMLAMSVGQVVGTAAFALFAYVVLRDVRARWRGEAASQAVASREDDTMRNEQDVRITDKEPQ